MSSSRAALSSPSPAAFRPALSQSAIFAGAPSCRASFLFRSFRLSELLSRFPTDPRPPYRAPRRSGLWNPAPGGRLRVRASWLLWAVARVRCSSPLAKSEYTNVEYESIKIYKSINMSYKKSRRKFQRDGAPVNGHKKAPQTRGGRKGKLYEEIRKNCINAG